MELTGSKLGKKYDKALYCHPAYLTSMQNTSCEILDWMNHKLESRLPGEISPTSVMEMIPMKNLDSVIKSRHLFAEKGAWFFNSHVQM